MKREFASLIVWIVVLIWLTAKPAYAYLDPATGNALLQALFASIVATLATGGFYWRSVRDFFTRLRHRDRGPHTGNGS